MNNSPKTQLLVVKRFTSPLWLPIPHSKTALVLHYLKPELEEEIET